MVPMGTTYTSLDARKEKRLRPQQRARKKITLRRLTGKMVVLYGTSIIKER
jgi:hypothetical protein